MQSFVDRSPPFLGDARIASLAGAWRGSTIMRAQTCGSGLRLAIPHRPPPRGGYLSLDMLVESPAQQTFLLSFLDMKGQSSALTIPLPPRIQTRLRFDLDHLNVDTRSPSRSDLPDGWTFAGASMNPNEIQLITLTLAQTLDKPLNWHQDMLKLYRDLPPSLTNPVPLLPN